LYKQIFVEQLWAIVFLLFRYSLNLAPVSAINEEQVKSAIIDVLRTVFDPEIPVNIYELGLIYEVNVFPDYSVEIVMTLTSPNCPAAASLPAEVEDKAKGVSGVKDVTLELVFDPPWNQEMMSEEARLELGFM
jgi:FeS assembly SUF system protein